ncbi:RodZ domain-containing protein [Marinobacter sp.]|uniref:RodZ domain-containing protein n=1 Tax=Marinobacter sp. TaxID=50741 RepID=UPI00384C6929
MINDDNPEQGIQVTVGDQLRKGREAAGLSISDVAERQHLRPAVIQSIENGDYQQIDSELFLKGYVRAYADQLGMPANALVAQLDQELEPLRREREATEHTTPLQDIERRKQRKKRVAKIIGVIVVILFVAYAVLRVIDLPVDNQEQQADIQPEDVQEPEVPVRDDEEGIGSGPEDIEIPEVPELPGAVPGGEAQVEELLPEASFAERESQDGFAEAQPVPAETVPQEPSDGIEPEALAEPQALEMPDIAPEVSSGLAAESQAEAEVVNLTASFMDPCWVQVTDADGRTIVGALFGPNDSLDVSGKPPMRVVIGAADAVSRLSFSGEIIDLAAYRIVNNRVEFTLDI